MMIALPRWKEIEFIAPQREPVVLEAAKVLVRRGSRPYTISALGHRALKRFERS